MGKSEQPIYRFSLSTRDEHFNDLKTICDWLKGQGDLSEFIRESIRLRADLLRGSHAVLDEQFPFVKTQVETPPKDDDGGMEDRIADKVAARIKVDMKNNAAYNIPDSRESGLPLMSPTMKPSKLAAHKIALPMIDDMDDPTILLSPAAYQNTGANLIAGILGMEDDDDDTIVITKASGSSNADTAMAAMRSIAF